MGDRSSVPRASQGECAQHAVSEQADNHRHRETQKSAQQDVFGAHQFFVVSQFSKTKLLLSGKSLDAANFSF